MYMISDNNVSRLDCRIEDSIVNYSNAYIGQIFCNIDSGLSKYWIFKDIFLSGTLGALTKFLKSDGSYISLENIYSTTSLNDEFIILASNSFVNNVNLVSIKFVGSYNKVVNSYLYRTSIDYNENYYSNCEINRVTFVSSTKGKFDNCTINSIVDDASSADMQFSNCYFETAITLSSDYFLFSNCNFQGITVSATSIENNITNSTINGAISISGNDTTISSSKIGADGGGGALTITVASGANRTIINGCRTDAAISDSGTDTVGIGNVVY